MESLLDGAGRGFHPLFKVDYVYSRGLSWQLKYLLVNANQDLNSFMNVK